MSFDAMAWACEQELLPAPKVLLIMLADMENRETRECRPTIKYLCRMTKIGRSKLFEHLKALEDLGLIERLERVGEDNRRLANGYFLCHPYQEGPRPSMRTPPVQPSGLQVNQVLSNQDSPSIVPPSEPNPPLDAKSQQQQLLGGSRGCRLPENWMPGDADCQFALNEGMNPHALNREADRFRDYWLAKTGAAATKRDWSATWRNWVRRAMDNGNGGGYSQAGATNGLAGSYPRQASTYHQQNGGSVCEAVARAGAKMEAQQQHKREG